MRRPGYPPGAVFPLADLRGLEADEVVEHRAEHPWSWQTVMLWECDQCRNVYALLQDEFEIHGKRREKGDIVKIHDRAMERIRQMWEPQGPRMEFVAQEPIVKDPAYAKERLRLVAEILGGKVPRAQLAERLLEMADRHPDHAQALVRDATKLAEAPESSGRDSG